MTDAIRTRKARAELTSFKEAKQQHEVSVIKTQKKERHEAALERKREYMRQYRARMEGNYKFKPILYK